MTLQKSSLLANNGSIQTFNKDGLHIQTEAVPEYILLETPSIAANSSRFFRLRDRLLTLQPIDIWFTPSATNQNFTFAIRQDTTTLYSFTISTANPYFAFPLMLIKPSQDIVLTTPVTLSLTNILIIGREVAYSETINAI